MTTSGRWCHSWYAEQVARLPFCITQNAKWTNSEKNKQGFALDVIFQNETVCNFCVRKNVLLFFHEAWNAYFIFRETWSRPPPPFTPSWVASPKLMMSIFGWGWQTQQMEDKVIGMVEIKSWRNFCVTILCLSILYYINFIYISVCNCIYQVKNRTNNFSHCKYINLC